MTKDELLYCDTRCVAFLCHKKRYCIVTQGEILYYDTGRVIVLWHKKRYFIMIQGELWYYDTRNVIELWYKKPYCIMPLEAVLHHDVRSVIIPYILFYNIKVKFADEGDNTVNDPGIYYAGGDTMLSPSLQPLTTGSVLKIWAFFSPFP